MRYLVTGGAGFIGAYVVQRLLEKGDEPIVFDLDLHQGILERVLSAHDLRSLQQIRGDMIDLPQLCHIVKSARIRRVIHLAAMQIPACQANPPIGLLANCLGTLNVLEAARILDLEKVVWASSIAVFGPASAHEAVKIANDAPHRPCTVYGSYKSTCEQLATHYTTAYGIDTLGFRYSGVYGLGRNRGKTSFSTTMIEKAVAREPYTVPYSTDLFGWQFVEDAADLTVLAASSDQTRTRVFNTHADVRSVSDGVAYLRTLVPDAKLTLEPGSMDIAWDLDASALEQELNYIPRHRMEDGIRKTFEAVKREREEGPASRS